MRLDRLVQDHLPAALKFAVRLTGDMDQAEEVVQEALARAARSWTTFRGEAGFRTWFWRILVNAFRDHLARRSQLAALPDDLCDVESLDPAQAAMESELAGRIAELISQLPARQREVLVLSVYEELSTREIANVLATSEANVRMNLSLARHRLRENLESYLAEK